MMGNYFGDYGNFVPMLNQTTWGLIGLLAVWDLAWKGWALWRAGRNNHLGWFVALLLINSLGILPIVYLFLVAPENNKK